MSDPEEPGDGGDTGGFLPGVSETDIQQTGPEALTLTPDQHEMLKEKIHGPRYNQILYSERRYLVIGAGGDTDAADRRQLVCDLLDDRKDAAGFRLEDFGLTPDEIDLWAAAFEILCEQSTHIVGVLEDFDGGHVWELGYIYRMQTAVRDILWMLKRIYADQETQRDNYDNGMAASHLSHLEAAVSDRVIEWEDAADLQAAVEEIP